MWGARGGAGQWQAAERQGKRRSAGRGIDPINGFHLQWLQLNETLGPAGLTPTEVGGRGKGLGRG